MSSQSPVLGSTKGLAALLDQLVQSGAGDVRVELSWGDWRVDIRPAS